MRRGDWIYVVWGLCTLIFIYFFFKSTEGDVCSIHLGTLCRVAWFIIIAFFVSIISYYFAIYRRKDV